MDIYIRYRGHDVLYRHVEVPTGCRVYYGDADLQQIFAQTHTLPSAIFGSESLLQVHSKFCAIFFVRLRVHSEIAEEILLGLFN